jgi:hypothetical protein
MSYALTSPIAIAARSEIAARQYCSAWSRSSIAAWRHPVWLAADEACRLPAEPARDDGVLVLGQGRLGGKGIAGLQPHGAMLGIIAPAMWPDPDQGTSAPMRL